MTRHLLSFGHGYCAQALARCLSAAGWQITGTTRSAEGAGRIAATGVTPLIWPGADQGADPRPALRRATHLLTSIAPDENGDPVLGALSDAIASCGHLRWIGYLSTTGVYGDRQGGWVDETSPLLPSTRRGRLRVLAESAWQDLARAHGLPLVIFRLAGIYGPGRGPFAKVRDGSARRIVKPGQVFSRIHVDDIARVLCASIAQPERGGIYNVCDDDPAPPEDVIAHAARLLGLPVPPAVRWDEAEMSAMARSFYSESKRIDNTRIKSELGVTLAYPDYRSGLAALLAGAQAGSQAGQQAD